MGEILYFLGGYAQSPVLGLGWGTQSLYRTGGHRGYIGQGLHLWDGGRRHRNGEGKGQIVTKQH